MQERVKKLALFLCLTLLVSCVYIGMTPNDKMQTTQAATKISKTVSMSRQLYEYKVSRLSSAKYSFSYDKTGYTKLWSTRTDSKYQYFMFSLLKPGKVTVTAKRTYKKKTSKVATINLTIKSDVDDGVPTENLYVQKGAVFTLDASEELDGADATITSSNTDVATVDGLTVTALATGTTKITMNGDTDETMKLHVVDDAITKTDTALNDKIAAVNNTKVKSSTLKSVHNQIAEICATLQDFDDDMEANGIVYNDDRDRDEVAVAMPESYMVAYRNLRTYELNTFDGGGASASILKFSKITSSSATIKLNHALTENEIIANYDPTYSGKYKSSSKAYYTFIVTKGGKEYTYYANVKKGTKTVTAKRLYRKVAKKSTYYYSISNTPKNTVTNGTIKAK